MDPEIHSAEQEAAANASVAKAETDTPVTKLEQEPEELHEEDGRTYVVTTEDHKAANWYGELQKAGMARILKPEEEGPDGKEDPEYGREQVRANQEAIQQQFADKFNAKAVRETSYFFDDIADMEPGQVEAEVAAQREQLTSKLDSLDEKIDRINFRLEDPGTRFNLERIDGRQELKEQFRIFEQLMREKAMAQERLTALDKLHEQYKSQQVVKQKDAEQATRLTEAAQKAGIEVPPDQVKSETKSENQDEEEKTPGLETPYVLSDKDVSRLNYDYDKWFDKHEDDVPRKLEYHLNAQLSILHSDLSLARQRAESAQKNVDIHTRIINESTDSNEKSYSKSALKDAKEDLANDILQARYLAATIPWLENKISEFKQKNADYWRRRAQEMRQSPVHQANVAQAETYSRYWETVNSGE